MVAHRFIFYFPYMLDTEDKEAGLLKDEDDISFLYLSFFLLLYWRCAKHSSRIHPVAKFQNVGYTPQHVTRVTLEFL